MFRDDDVARAAYLEALERKAARINELEDRIRELEVENRELHAAVARGSPPSPADAGDGSIHVYQRMIEYVERLIHATDPRRTEGILSGARPSDAASLIDRARANARTAGRNYVIPDDVRRCALEILPTRIMMTDPEDDPRRIVRAILDVVEVP